MRCLHLHRVVGFLFHSVKVFSMLGWIHAVRYWIHAVCPWITVWRVTVGRRVHAVWPPIHVVHLVFEVVELVRTFGFMGSCRAIGARNIGGRGTGLAIAGGARFAGVVVTRG